MKNKYRLIVYPALDLANKSMQLEFKTKEEAVASSDSCANLLLFIQDDLKAMKDYSNSFYLEVFEDGEWIELD